jgi:predicted RNA-binding protein with PIN domain
VDFASSDETADDRIVALVEGADEAQPVLVVTSDRELGRRCAALHVDVVPAEAFLATAT